MALMTALWALLGTHPDSPLPCSAPRCFACPIPYGVCPALFAARLNAHHAAAPGAEGDSGDEGGDGDGIFPPEWEAHDDVGQTATHEPKAW